MNTKHSNSAAWRPMYSPLASVVCTKLHRWINTLGLFDWSYRRIHTYRRSCLDAPDLAFEAGLRTFFRAPAMKVRSRVNPRVGTICGNGTDMTCPLAQACRFEGIKYRLRIALCINGLMSHGRVATRPPKVNTRCHSLMSPSTSLPC